MRQGGKREGAGRPKGSIEPAKLAQKKAFEDLKMTVLRAQDSLLRAQMGVAKGLTFLYVIRTKEINGKIVREKPEIVKSKEEIEKYLAGELDNEEHEYYYMSTEKPDSKTIDSLLDRVHGKARQNIGLDGGEDDKPIAIKSVEDELRNWANKK